MSRYALCLKPSSPSHIPDPDGKTTLCGLPLSILGSPLWPEHEAAHVHCRTCDRAIAAARSVRSPFVAQGAR